MKTDKLWAVKPKGLIKDSEMVHRVKGTVSGDNFTWVHQHK